MKKQKGKRKQVIKKVKFYSLPYRLKDYTYQEICTKLEIEFKVLEKVILGKKSNFLVLESDKLTILGWLLIKDYYYPRNKLVIEKNRAKSPFLVTKNVGNHKGITPNFYKIIYTGQIN